MAHQSLGTVTKPFWHGPSDPHDHNKVSSFKFLYWHPWSFHLLFPWEMEQKCFATLFTALSMQNMTFIGKDGGCQWINTFTGKVNQHPEKIVKSEKKIQTNKWPLLWLCMDAFFIIFFLGGITSRPPELLVFVLFSPTTSFCFLAWCLDLSMPGVPSVSVPPKTGHWCHITFGTNTFTCQ